MDSGETLGFGDIKAVTMRLLVNKKGVYGGIARDWEYIQAFLGVADEADDEADSALPDISSSVIASWGVSLSIFMNG